MTENKSPFTEYATKANRRPDATRWGWIVAGILAALLLAALLLWATAVGKMRAMESLRTKLDDANASLAAAQNQNETNRNPSHLTIKNHRPEQEKEASSQMAKALENEMRSKLESKDVTISNLQGRLTVNIVDRVMFNSGEAVLKPDGQSVMRRLAAVFAAHPELKYKSSGTRTTCLSFPMRAAGLRAIGNFPPLAPWRRFTFSPKTPAWYRAASGSLDTVNIGQSRTTRPLMEEPRTSH